jgi:environmental stress-induced protein Ves
MNREVILIQENDKKISSWSGGLTSEFFIYPETANYQKRDFIFRISSATVYDEESEFTMLPGFDRILLLLEGKLKLVHDNAKEVNLKAFEFDYFDGGSKTLSYGTCVDFNLMIKQGCKGSVMARRLDDSQNEFSIDCHCINVVFSYNGEIKFRTSDSIYILNQGGCAVIFPQNKENNVISIQKFSEEAVVIMCAISLDDNMYN